MSYLINLSFILTTVTILSCSLSTREKPASVIKENEPDVTVLINNVETVNVYFDTEKQNYSVIYLDSKDSLVVNIRDRTGELYSLEDGNYINISELPFGQRLIGDIVSSEGKLSLEIFLSWSDITDREEIFNASLTDGREVKEMIVSSQSSDTLISSLTGINNVFNHFRNELFSNFQNHKLVNYENVFVNGIIQNELYEFDNGALSKIYTYSNGNLSSIKSIITGDSNSRNNKVFVYH